MRTSKWVFSALFWAAAQACWIASVELGGALSLRAFAKSAASGVISAMIGSISGFIFSKSFFSDWQATRATSESAAVIRIGFFIGGAPNRLA